MDIMQMLQGLSKQDPNILYNTLIRKNSNFQKFVEENKNLSPEEIASKYNIDYSIVKRFMR